jgi:serine/threonine protein kinase
MPTQFSCVRPLSRSPGRGHGAATVFKAVHNATGREVAVKTYLKRDLERGGGGDRVRRVAVEREALARIAARRHQQRDRPASKQEAAPALLAATHDEYAVALIMQLAQGGTAADMVRGGPRGRPAAVVGGIVDALAEVHAAGVLHLDLTLENIVVGPDGVTIVDYGSAALEDVVEGERDYARASSVEVLPPELVDDSGVPTRAADVWGLGVAAFRMVCGGKGPWRGEGDFQIMDEVARREAGGPLAFPDGVGGDAIDFVQRCLHPEPLRRLGVAASSGGGLVVDYEQIRQHPFLRNGTAA